MHFKKSSGSGLFSDSVYFCIFSDKSLRTAINTQIKGLHTAKNPQIIASALPEIPGSAHYALTKSLRAYLHCCKYHSLPGEMKFAAKKSR